jgi:hypothetical protein
MVVEFEVLKDVAIGRDRVDESDVAYTVFVNPSHIIAIADVRVGTRTIRGQTEVVCRDGIRFVVRGDLKEHIDRLSHPYVRGW